MHSTTILSLAAGHDQTESSFLRASMGDFGVALFAPLLHLETQQQQQPHPPRRQHPQHPQFLGSFSNDNSPKNKQKPVLLQLPFSEKDSGDGAVVGCAGGDSSSSSILGDDDPENPEDDCTNDSDEQDSQQEENVNPMGYHHPRLIPEPVAQLQACPRLLTDAQMQELRKHLPTPQLRSYTWERCFAIGWHGDSFATLLQACQAYAHTIIVIRTTRNEILGGFASEPWQSSSSSSSSSSSCRQRQRRQQSAYYGTGQSFVFASHPAVEPPFDSSHNNNDDNSNNSNNNNPSAAAPPLLHVYPWTGNNDYCQICDSQRRILCMGGVGDFGWIVADDFTVGQTGHCATFGNPPLTSLSSSASFAIADLEIYGLTSPLGWWYQQQQQPPPWAVSSTTTTTTSSLSSLSGALSLSCTMTRPESMCRDTE